MRSDNENGLSIGNTRKFLKQRLMTQSDLFKGYEEQHLHLKHMLKRTVEHGESNSALLIGPRGSGKTTLTSKIIVELQNEAHLSSEAMFVHLSGIIHTNDRLALQSITIQLQLETAVEGKVFGSFSDNLAYLLACLKAGDKESKSVIFIIDEFDLFCSHHNQTLLYNLFDVAQSAQAPICVLGITCRLDVVELLEKRVKSRFSHRQIFLWDDKNTNIISQRTELFKTLLILPKSLSKKTGNNLYIQDSYLQSWNGNIENIIKLKQVLQNLKNIFELDLSGKTLQNLLMMLISKISTTHQLITESDIADLCQYVYADNKVFMLIGLSVLEICLLIAMKHHYDIYDGEPTNFEMVYNRYKKFTNGNTSVQTVQREVVQKAFEHLLNLELISPVGSGSKAHKEYQLHNLLVTPAEIMSAVKKYVALPTEVVQWASSSLV